MSVSSRIAGRQFDFRDGRGLGATLRRRRAGPLLELIDAAYERHGRVNVLDIGGTRGYWTSVVPDDYLDDRNVQITILNRPGGHASPAQGRFSFVEGDACKLDAIPRDAFHVAHSNSVIEHVGDWEHMRAYASEVARVAEAYFVQTPNFWFPVEPHAMTPLFHWLPKPLRIRLVMRFDLGHWRRQDTMDEAVRRVDSARLLDHTMFSELFRDARIVPERLGFLTKSWIAVRSAASPRT